MAPAETEFSPMESPAGASFVASVCLPFLRSAQNPDGGWGFRAGRESRAEPTSWALLALTELDSRAEVEAGFRFLRSTQLDDGSWSATPGQQTGCWVTSVACWALLGDAESRNAVAAGLGWICRDWPKDLNFIRRAIRKIRSGKLVSQDDSLRGWGWTPNTASWVEPTALALLALDQAPKDRLPSQADRRRRLARAMLYDRMCPGGGWNSGNPMVYGVAGDPSIPQTVWALLAVRDEPDRTQQTSSLQWLENSLQRAAGVGSVALAKICLETYGKESPEGARRLVNLYETNGFICNVPTVAWACLALSPRSRWLRMPKALES